MPPGFGAFTTVIGWAKWVGLGIAVVGLIMLGVSLTVSARRGEGGEIGGWLGRLLIGVIIISAAFTIAASSSGTDSRMPRTAQRPIRRSRSFIAGAALVGVLVVAGIVVSLGVLLGGRSGTAGGTDGSGAPRAVTSTVAGGSVCGLPGMGSAGAALRYCLGQLHC